MSNNGLVSPLAGACVVCHVPPKADETACRATCGGPAGRWGNCARNCARADGLFWRNNALGGENRGGTGSADCARQAPFTTIIAIRVNTNTLILVMDAPRGCPFDSRHDAKMTHQLLTMFVKVAAGQIGRRPVGNGSETRQPSRCGTAPS